MFPLPFPGRGKTTPYVLFVFVRFVVVVIRVEAPFGPSVDVQKRRRRKDPWERKR